MRVFVYGKREKRITAVILVIVFGLLIALPWASAAEKMLPIYRVKTDQNKIALTFDVAWEDSDLDDILAMLDQHQAKATFFITGDFAQRFPERVKQISDSGHDVENHSNRHPHVNKLSESQVKDDASACNDILKSITGKDTVYYRAPYGEYNNTVMSALSSYQVIQWDVDSRDWKPDAQANAIAQFVCEKTKSGSILLFHVDSKAKQTTDALSMILPQLSKNYQTVLLCELIPSPPYNINANGELVAQ